MRRRTTRSLCLALALLSLAAPRVGAQTRDEERAAALRRLQVGQELRLDVREVGRLHGRFLFRNDSMLALAQFDEPAQIRLPDIERLWVRRRATGTGAFVGAGVGLLAGVAYGLLIGPVACEPVDGGDCTTAEVAALTGLLGGASGAVVGAGVGFMIRVWRLRFP